MVTGNGHTSRLVDASGRPFAFGYDAAEDKKQRQTPRFRLMTEDKQLPPEKRKRLVATSRDVVRNWTIAGWMIRKHLDYCSTFSFQARTPDEAVNQRLEELVAWWSRKRNFDVAGRHGRARYVRMAEARRTLDGDFFTLKMKNGRVQAIEGDRFRTPTSLPKGVEPDDVVHGVIVDKAGGARGYCLHNRGKWGDGFDFDRVLTARHVLGHGYYDRFDQVRGVSLVAPGINVLQDTYEGLGYAAVKAKLAQMFGVVFKQSEEQEESLGEVTITTDNDGLPKKAETEIKFGGAPVQLDLNPDEDVTILESSHPQQQFQEFLRLLIMVGLKAVDIPYCFFDEGHTNYAGNRQAWLLYDQSAENKRDDNRELLNALLAWRVGLWIIDGVLELPKGMSIADVRWEWIARAIPWIDPLKEIMADIRALEARLTSRQRICKRNGVDFFEIADELALEEEYLQGVGLSESESSSAALARVLKRRTQQVACLKDYVNAAA